jgi:hypothetical protein
MLAIFCANHSTLMSRRCCCMRLLFLQLPIASVRPPLEDTTGYTGVAAPKRKRVEEEPTLDQAPPKVGNQLRWCAKSPMAVLQWLDW